MTDNGVQINNDALTTHAKDSFYITHILVHVPPHDRLDGVTRSRRAR